MKNKINIIGCGYIGQQVALKLIQKSLQIVAYVKTNASLSECKHKNIESKLLDLDSALCSIKIKNEKVLYLVPPQPEGVCE